MSVLRQDHYAFDNTPCSHTVIMGNRRLYDIMKEKDALYEKPDFSEDGMNAPQCSKRSSPSSTAGRRSQTRQS